MQRGAGAGFNTFRQPPRGARGPQGGRRAPEGGPIILGGDGGGGDVPLSRGVLLPGFITDDALNGAGVSTAHIRFARQGFAYDDTTYATGAHDNTGWGLVGGSHAHNAKVNLGSSIDPFVAYCWGSFDWENGSANAHTGNATFVLYIGTDTNADGVTDTWTAYKRSVSFASTALPLDGRAHQLSPIAQFVVPFVDGAEWWVGMQSRVSSASNPASPTQSIRHQTVMAFTCAFDTELDDALAGDTLE